MSAPGDDALVTYSEHRTGKDSAVGASGSSSEAPSDVEAGSRSDVSGGLSRSEIEKVTRSLCGVGSAHDCRVEEVGGHPHFSPPKCLSRDTSSLPAVSTIRHTPLLSNSSSHSGFCSPSADAASCSNASSSASLAEREPSAGGGSTGE